MNRLASPFLLRFEEPCPAPGRDGLALGTKTATFVRLEAPDNDAARRRIACFPHDGMSRVGRTEACRNVF